MKNYLIYDPITKVGVMTMRCHLKQMSEYDPLEEPFIEIGDLVDDPSAWRVEDGEAVPHQKEITADQVNEERDRRITAGFVFNNHTFDFDPASKENITGAGAMAGTAIALGAVTGDLHWHGGADPFEWISADNVKVQLDAHAMFAMSQAAAEHVRAHVFAARFLKDMAVILPDFQEDSHWP